MTSKYKNFLVGFEPKPLQVSGNRIYINDFIDGDFGVGLADINDALAEFTDGDRVEVHINSPGGSVSEGVAIANVIAGRPRTDTIISGMAASIASVIAMGGDNVSMYPNSMLMIHKPMSIVLGGADTMRKEADVLDKIEDEMLIPSYSRTGLATAELKEMLAAETWMGAKEAKEKRFIDSVVDNSETDAENAARSARVRKNYLHELRARAIRMRYGS